MRAGPLPSARRKALPGCARGSRVEPDEKEVKVQSHARAQADGDLPVKAIKAELATRKLLILLKEPYIARIHEKKRRANTCIPGNDTLCWLPA